MEDELAQAWSPVSHLNSVRNSDDLREAYNACLPLLSEYSTWMGQHTALCDAYQQIADSADFGTETAQRKTIENALRDFRLAGVSLPPAKAALRRVAQAPVGTGQQVWGERAGRDQCLVPAGHPGATAGPARYRPGQRQAGSTAGRLEDYLINLEFPSYSPVLTYCDDRN